MTSGNGTREQLATLRAAKIPLRHLGYIFGVGTRGIHYWMSGGKISAANAAILADLVAFLDGKDNPAKALVTRDETGRSYIDYARARRARPRGEDINGSVDPFYFCAE